MSDKTPASSEPYGLTLLGRLTPAPAYSAKYQSMGLSGPNYLVEPANPLEGAGAGEAPADGVGAVPGRAPTPSLSARAATRARAFVPPVTNMNYLVEATRRTGGAGPAPTGRSLGAARPTTPPAGLEQDYSPPMGAETGPAVSALNALGVVYEEEPSRKNRRFTVQPFRFLGEDGEPMRYRRIPSAPRNDTAVPALPSARAAVGGQVEGAGPGPGQLPAVAAMQPLTARSESTATRPAVPAGAYKAGPRPGPSAASPPAPPPPQGQPAALPPQRSSEQLLVEKAVEQQNTIYRLQVFDPLHRWEARERGPVRKATARHNERAIQFFNEHRAIDDETELLEKGRAYVFFTRPDCRLREAEVDRGTKDDPNYTVNKALPLLDHFREDVWTQLTSQGAGSAPFMRILTNQSMGHTPTPTTTQTKDVKETMLGYKMRLPGSNAASVTAGEFSMEFAELSGAEVTKLFKLWTDYIEGVRRGYVTPSDRAVRLNYLDYACSMYYFLLAPDGYTIVSWTKYTGVFPTSVPYDAFGYQMGTTNEAPKVSVQFAYTHKEDMDIAALSDFGFVSGSLKAAVAQRRGYTISNAMASAATIAQQALRGDFKSMVENGLGTLRDYASQAYGAAAGAVSSGAGMLGLWANDAASVITGGQATTAAGGLIQDPSAQARALVNANAEARQVNNNIRAVQQASPRALPKKLSDSYMLTVRLVKIDHERYGLVFTK